MAISYKLGLAQIEVVGGDRNTNLLKAKEAVLELAARGCRLILLPEAMNLGWTHPSCHREAESIPDGPTCQLLRELAETHQLYLCAGLVERDDHKNYNAAVIIAPSGKVILRHRKIMELSIAHDCYECGTSLGVVDTTLGRLGLMICADGFAKKLALSHSLALMGADVILSPSAWAVSPDFDHAETPYGQLWLDSYSPVCKEHGIIIAGCSNVGEITSGPWKDHRCIGHSLVMGADGAPILTGPYDEPALLDVSISLA